MRIIGCDLHARQQTIAMLDTDTGELVEKVIEHEGEKVQEFYSAECYIFSFFSYFISSATGVHVGSGLKVSTLINSLRVARPKSFW